jgi:DNA-binding transcriptional regulator YhcF (GntR family)
MEFNSQIPIFVQIANLVIDEVLERKLKPNDRIPSVRDLATQVQVNPNTVMRSFAYLQDQEVIYNQRGIGYFISDDAFTKALETRRKEFVETFLPELSKKMQLLNIDGPELLDLINRQQHGI